MRIERELKEIRIERIARIHARWHELLKRSERQEWRAEQQREIHRDNGRWRKDFFPYIDKPHSPKPGTR